MKTNGKLPIKQRFEEAARRRRRDPNRLLTQFMRECLESWEDEQLDKEITKQVRRSGLREEDAVDCVGRVRQARKQRRGNS